MSQLQPVKGLPLTSTLWRVLTHESISAGDESESFINAIELRQFGLTQYPLRQVRVMATRTTPELLSKLLSVVAAAPTLESIVLESPMPDDVLANLALQLKAAPNLRAVNLADFPIDAGLQLLQSRTDWVRIILPTKADNSIKASAFAPSNRADFELCVKDDADAACINRWLANPHLTALDSRGCQFPEACLDVLQHCKNLTSLVRAASTISM
jgi:hypothetical protein